MPKQGTQGRRIVRLTAENVKRIRAVNIQPDGDLIVITGKNSQGKTSVLDSIWLALGGGEAGRHVDKVIRDGQDAASAVVDLGDLIVQRTWARKEDDSVTSKIEVRSKDGAVYKKPQQMLDEMLGALSFDPLAFSRMGPKEQVEALMRASGKTAELNTLDANRKRAFDERQDVNRRVRDLQGEIRSLPAPAPETPTEEVSMVEMVRRARALTDQRNERAKMLQQIATCKVAAEATAGLIANLTRHLDEARARLIEQESESNERQAEYDAMPSLPEAGEFQAEIDATENVNAAVRAAKTYRDLEQRLTVATAQADALTLNLCEIDRQKSEIVRASGLPIDGVTLSDNGVALNGVPFVDCSASEQLRVSVAIAMALNPNLRVIRVADGSLMDSDSMALLHKMAEDNDFQVWVERVDDSGEGIIVIEDGAVKS